MTTVDGDGSGSVAAVYATRLTAIAEIQEDIASGNVEHERLLAILAARTQSLTHADGAMVEVPEGSDMVSHAGSGLATQHIGLRLPIDRSLSGLVVRTGAVLVCDDIWTDPRTDLEIYRLLEIESAVVMPLRRGGRFAGVLEVLSRRTNAFDDVDVQTLRMMAGLAGILVNAPTAAHSTESESNVEHSIDQSSLSDRVTGLPVRAILLDRLRQAITLGRRRNEPVAVLLLDVSAVQSSDAPGEQPSTNGPLATFTERVKRALRASDTVARSGDDQVAVVLPGASAIGALGTAHKLLRAAGLSAPGINHSSIPNPPVGIALFPDHADDAETLLLYAGKALQRARGEDDRCAMYAGEEYS
ncbi:MAG: hypothetical protein NVSMB52_17800 [Chloroflexota bacterium]